MRPIALIAAGLATLLASAAHAGTFEQTGSASWYGANHHGKKTASGERFNMHKLTAAHPKLPLGSVLEVTNLANDRTVQLRVNDRGPYASARILDVSRAAAEQLGFIGAGTAKVRIRLVDPSSAELRPKLPAEPEAPTVAPGLEPTDELAPALGPTQTYAVRIGAFAVLGNADRAAKRLSGLGAVTVAEDWGSGRVLHRVSLTGLADLKAAEAARAAAAEAGFADAAVVAPAT